MPDFSPVAVHYARARPRYPDALFSYLASLVESRRVPDLLWRLYEEHLFADFAPGARLVDHRYETLELPNPITPAQRFEATASWTLDQMIEFILSWSGSHAFMRRTSVNPVDLIRGELERMWGPRDRVHALRWPIYLKLSRF